MTVKVDTFTWDKTTKEMLSRLAKVENAVKDPVLNDVCTGIADALLEESVKRTPIDEGFLIASQTKFVTEVGGWTGGVYIPSNSPAADYAIPLHEGTYNLGPHSAIKQASSSVTVGRKFLERALFESVPLFQRFIKNRLIRFFKEGK